MLDVRRLSVLREVAARGSFSAAAEALYLSQSAVSQQVATLEREVATRLFERTRSGPKLTEAGRLLVTHADAAIARLEEAERDLAALAGLEGGEVRLASFPSASATIVTSAISEFVARHPKVRPSVGELEPEQSLPALRAGEIDLAVTFDYPRRPEPEERDVERALLLTEAMHVALPEGHRLAGAARVRLADLAGEDWLCGTCPSSCGELVKDVCRDAGFEPRVAFESDDYVVQQGYVAAGLGVTLLPDLALSTLRSDVVIRPIAADVPTRRVWAATRAVGSRSAATDAMLAVLREAGESFAVAAPEPAVA